MQSNASSLIHGVAQSQLWLTHWQEQVNADCFAVGLFSGEELVILLPLEVITTGGKSLAQFPGGTHANCNFPLLNPVHASKVNQEALRQLFALIKSKRPDVEMLALTRLLASCQQLDNPLLLLTHQHNPNPMLMASLPDSFDAVLARSNASRKRKKHRQHSRRYEEAGGWKIYTATTAEQCNAAFEAYFQMKTERFIQQGISNSFADKGVYPFFQALFADATKQLKPEYTLRVLEVGGKPRAVIGIALWDNGLTVEFGGFANDELVTASPGEFLFYEDIAENLQQGLKYYSFGIGDEHYKRDWCDIELPLHDRYIPLTIKGRLSAMRARLRAKVALTIKSNPLLWEQFKKLRRLLKSTR